MTSSSSPPSNVFDFRSNEDFLRDYDVDFSQPLGEGGYGAVFAGTRKKDACLVAVKRVPLSKVTNWELTVTGQVMPKELTLLLQAQNCTGVIQLYDSCRNAQHFFLVMEYTEETCELFHYVERKEFLAERETVGIIRQVIHTAISCQINGIFHRDIKLDNILYNETTGKTTLIDFGCGTMISSPHEKFVEYEGAPDCIPPEYFLKDSYAAEPSTVWSIGVLTFTMIFGREPFPTPKDIIHHRLRMSHGMASPDALAFILKCLNPNEHQRGTLESLLSHPWMVEVSESEIDLSRLSPDSSDSEKDDEYSSSKQELTPTTPSPNQSNLFSKIVKCIRHIRKSVRP